MSDLRQTVLDLTVDEMLFKLLLLVFGQIGNVLHYDVCSIDVLYCSTDVLYCVVLY